MFWEEHLLNLVIIVPLRDGAGDLENGWIFEVLLWSTGVYTNANLPSRRVDYWVRSVELRLIDIPAIYDHIFGETCKDIWALIWISFKCCHVTTMKMFVFFGWRAIVFSNNVLQFLNRIAYTTWLLLFLERWNFQEVNIVELDLLFGSILLRLIQLAILMLKINFWVINWTIWRSRW